MKLRYVELPPDRIFNRLGIENHTARLQFGEKFKDTWWTPEVVKLREEFARIWVEEFDKMTGHFSLLEESIRKSGIQRPISTVSGPPRNQTLTQAGKETWFFPPGVPIREVIYTQPFGGSRVTIAQRLDLTIPCAVHDFSDLFPNAPEITATNYKKWFGNDYNFTPTLPHLRLRRQSHIKDAKYNAMNQHTRDAQRRASQVAKRRLGI